MYIINENCFFFYGVIAFSAEMLHSHIAILTMFIKLKAKYLRTLKIF